ncbi:MAG: Fe-S cluster assembly protein SufD [Kiritimatiellia bacterium]
MIGIKEGQKPYLEQFAQLAKATAGESAWVRALRQRGVEQFAALGFPTPRDENWKYTDVTPIITTAFQPAAKADSGVTREALDRGELTTLQCDSRLVFVNGFFSEQLSSIGELPAGVKVTNLAQLFTGEEQAIGCHLGRYAHLEEHAFVALNTAMLQDGALVEVAQGCRLEEPILIVFVATADGAPMVSHPRNLYCFGAESRATIIESYLSLGEGAHFTNAVSELVVGEGAVIEHYKLQHENEQAFHIATLQAIQARDSHLLAHNISFGGAITRNDINVVLDAEDAECDLGGLFVATGCQHVDNHTLIDHAQPNCNSRELYKGILGDQSVGIFNGKILVRQGAQKTNASQRNNNLLLSENATINTKPQLEIYADDVRCKHGATVGQISAEALFYMRSRGITKEAALDLLTYGFAGELFDSMTWVTVRSRLEQMLYRKLSKNRQED